jgi:protein phosphatase 1 regulatory subunit 42
MMLGAQPHLGGLGMGMGISGMGLPMGGAPGGGGRGGGGGSSSDVQRGGGGGGRLSRRAADPVAEAERKAQQEKLYAMDAERILAGQDRRTTLMIKNIPNKYTQKMLLATIDEHFHGTYDFFYLPIDFKNKCNVGYAFINLSEQKSIKDFYLHFHNSKWEFFRSGKV